MEAVTLADTAAEPVSKAWSCKSAKAWALGRSALGSAEPGGSVAEPPAAATFGVFFGDGERPGTRSSCLQCGHLQRSPANSVLTLSPLPQPGQLNDIMIRPRGQCNRELIDYRKATSRHKGLSRWV